MKFRTKSKKANGRVLHTLLFLYAGLLLLLGCADALIPGRVSVRCGEIPCERVLSARTGHGLSYTEERPLLFCGIPLKTVSVTAVSDRKLCPGGMLFGVRCRTDGVLVAGLEPVRAALCPAKEAGLRPGDVITAADGVPVTSSSMLMEAVAAAGQSGTSVSFAVRRGEERFVCDIAPLCAPDGIWRAGLWARDTAAGIGTVTFYDPATGAFGGLGHGICDSETGTLLPLSRGTVLGVKLGDILAGKAGAPGELRGSLTAERTGTLASNSDAGVFGYFSEAPENLLPPLPVGLSSEVHEGEASLLCSLSDGAPRAYAIRILRPAAGKTPSKSFVIEVTDPDLLAVTGGIVQGMSGSPIVQDGRLIGAVTHVLVNDPTRGYGIYMETMLSAAG